MCSAKVSLFAAVLGVAPFLATSNFTCGASNNATMCSALGDLYSVTRGALWNNQSGWSSAANGTATSYCTFYGAKCSGGALTYLCVHVHVHVQTGLCWIALLRAEIACHAVCLRNLACVRFYEVTSLGTVAAAQFRPAWVP
jgi:hypothetical protein